MREVLRGGMRVWKPTRVGMLAHADCPNRGTGTGTGALLAPLYYSLLEYLGNVCMLSPVRFPSARGVAGQQN